MKNFIIRKANINDAREIIEVGTKTWITTYKGLMSDKILDERISTMEKRQERLENELQNNNNWYVSIVDNKVVGFVSYGKSRNEKYKNYGEINAIYVLKEYQKLGIGKALFLKGIEELINQGFKNVILNVLEGNKTIDFYKYFGGEVIEERYDYFSNELINEHIMLFKDINNIKSKRRRNNERKKIR